MSFCAVCTRERPRDELVLRPLGRGGALVLICRRCDEEKPIARDDTRGYRAPDRADAIAQNIARIARDAALELPRLRHQTYARDKAAGRALVVVPTFDRGVFRDRDEARRTLAAEQWAAEAKYLGTVKRGRRSVHLFERPDAAREKIEPSTESRIERRAYACSDRAPSRTGRSSVTATCPFCRAEVVMFLLSLAGTGKRCACGAKFSSNGTCARLVVRVPGREPGRSPP